MKREESRRDKTDRTVYQRVKPFTIVGAAIALGLIGFDPDDPVQAEPVEQPQDDVQPIVRDFKDGSPDASRVFSDTFPLSGDRFTYEIPEK